MASQVIFYILILIASIMISWDFMARLLAMMIFFYLILVISGLLFRVLKLRKLMGEHKAALVFWMDTVTSPLFFPHGMDPIQRYVTCHKALY